MRRIKNRILALFMATVLTFGLTGCQAITDFLSDVAPQGIPIGEGSSTTDQAPPAATDNEEFNAFLKEQFIEDVSSDTFTLHYTLKDPSAYGISLDPTFGDLDFLDTETAEKEFKETYDELMAFDYGSLSAKQQQDFDVIRTYMEDNMGTTEYNLYGTAFGTVSGIQSNLPINFAEYKFYIEKDITDYLSLLQQVPDYFTAALQLEQARIDAGLGLQDFQLDEVIKQCKDFISVTEGNYLISTFDSRIDAFEGIDEAKKAEYKELNKTAVMESIFPAYENLISTLETYKGKAQISGGICKLPNGKDYYELMVRHDTGSAKSMKEIIELLEDGMKDAMNMMYTAATLDYDGYESYFEEESIEYGSSDPGVLLDTLKLAMMESYPAPPKTQYTIKYVEEALEETMSPAFYMVPPIDDSVENVIYINRGSNSSSSLFTTLAHEGYPGHLYQTNYYNSTNPTPIRQLLNFPGYVEGWATYVEIQSPELFNFTEHNEAYTLMEQAMTKLNLVVASRIDVGVNYEGWSLADTENYLMENGLNTEIAKDVYEYVVCEPANYLKYCVGGLEFFELQEYAKHKLGDKFDMKEFNKALLECGPCQFEYVKESVDRYIEANR